MSSRWEGPGRGADIVEHPVDAKVPGQVFRLRRYSNQRVTGSSADAFADPVAGDDRRQGPKAAGKQETDPGSHR